MIRMAGQLQAAQIDTTRRAQDYARYDTRRGHWLGFVAAVLAMLLAFGCLLLQYPWVAAAFLSVPVMAVAKALIDTATSRPQAQPIQPPAPAPPPQPTTAAPPSQPTSAGNKQA